jgi:CDP-diacylglycerol--serine O-phosphatidyltransferase
MTLACFYPFSQTPFFQENFADLRWLDIMAVAVVLIGVLLVSHVPYARFPKIGIRTTRGVVNTVLVLAGVFAALTVPRYFLFSLGALYITWGLLRSVILGLLDRLPGGDPLLDEDEEEDSALTEVRTLDYAELKAQPRNDQDVARKPEDMMEDRA